MRLLAVERVLVFCEHDANLVGLKSDTNGLELGAWLARREKGKMQMRITIPAKNAADAEFDMLQRTHCIPIPGGRTRDVYEVPADTGGHGERKVLKVAKAEHIYNWNEIVLSQHFNADDVFGQVLSWSQSGKYIVMEWLENTTTDRSGSFPWPSVVTDRKSSALGRRRDGKVVVRDSGLLKGVVVGRDWSQKARVLEATQDEPWDGYQDDGVDGDREWSFV